jgi:ribosome biogenesis GTPase
MKWKGKDFESMAQREKMTRAQNKRKHEKDLSDFFELEESKWPMDRGSFKARVVEVHKRYVFVSPEPTLGDIRTRDVWLAGMARRNLQAVRKERNVFSVGDRVLCLPGQVTEDKESLPQCTVLYRAPRTNQLARLDPMVPERKHVLACNVDQIVIVASYLAPKVKWGLIDRYLVLAEEESIPAVIILNKKDLLKKEGSPELKALCEKYEAIYQSLGYPCLSFCAQKSGKDAKALLAKLFNGKITLLSGHSGVGKSSLVNLLKPEIVQDVESESILTKGRHTTSYASFIKLKTGGYVIDTPGIRSFLVDEYSAIDLSHRFVEMRPYLGQCRYRECSHISEPECAVREAVEKGLISPLRYQSYIGILTGATGREGRIRDGFDDEIGYEETPPHSDDAES